MQSRYTDSTTPLVTIAIPTLAADDALEACLASLRAQSFRDFTVTVIDNSGGHLVAPSDHLSVIANEKNAGFGAAINQVFRTSRAPFLAVLNDDTIAHPNWLEALVGAISKHPEVGMCASQIRLAGNGLLDSAGMLVCADASSKQRGHMQSPEEYASPEKTLCPSGCAALYRREMLDDIGIFDESFFLYCEDTDLGLRARWAGWECLYVPDAIVEHRYSHSAGAASPLKAYYVERNRLFVAVKNFPARALLLSPVYSLIRYFWHGFYVLQGRGAASRFRSAGNETRSLGKFIVRAHLEVLARLPMLWKQRRLTKRRLNAKQYYRLLREFSISPRQVAKL